MNDIKMKLGCASGTGVPPPFVAEIDESKKSIHIRRGPETEVVSFVSAVALAERCIQLAADRVPFSVGGQWPGPSEEMEVTQVSRRLLISFLSISWRGPDKWVIREAVPNAQQWDLVALQELIERPPIVLQ